jgi:hypothetical protein
VLASTDLSQQSPAPVESRPRMCPSPHDAQQVSALHALSFARSWTILALSGVVTKQAAAAKIAFAIRSDLNVHIVRLPTSDANNCEAQFEFHRHSTMVTSSW